MKKSITAVAALILIIVVCLSTQGVAAPTPRQVTIDNFARAESHRYFTHFASEGGFGKLKHSRKLVDIDKQTVIRLNRDTLYSFGVFDLNASPVTITLPEGGKRFMSVQVINEDHFTPDVFYAPGTHTLTREEAGTRYICLAIRTFVDPNDPKDIEAVHALQDAIKLEQKTTGKLELPDWDQSSLNAIRQALLDLGKASGGLDSIGMFGSRDEIDPVRHLIGSAAGWGGNPRSTAIYDGVAPENNDGKTPCTLTLKDVPVDGFWSVSVYNSAGYFVKNKRNAYSVNNATAKTNADGSVTIHFGGEESAPNFIPIMPGWNYLLRMYRPRKELLDGTWAPPAARIAK